MKRDQLGVWATEQECLTMAKYLNMDLVVNTKYNDGQFCWQTFPVQNLQVNAGVAIYLENSGIHFEVVMRPWT